LAYHRENNSNRKERVIQPLIIQRSGHNISRSNISKNAVKVLYRLHKAGYEAHLVGGAVRDLLLGREPKDFDIATDATPEEVRQLFRNCRLIGRRFRLAHVHFGPEIIEVATFRSMQPPPEDEHQNEEGMILRDNIYGSIEEDAMRRDFTVNALYYNIADFSIIDYAGGVDDISKGELKLLGDPEQRYREDPVRMLRAVRFSAKLGFRITGETLTPIAELADLLDAVPSARLFEEILKLFMAGQAYETFHLLHQYGLLQYLFPSTDAVMSGDYDQRITEMIDQGLRNTDERIEVGKPVTPAFLFAVMLWEPVRELAAELQQEEQLAAIPALQQAASEVLSAQAQRVAIPKRLTLMMRDIWSLQPRFENRAGKRPMRLLSHPKFRAAYDFMLLRAQAGEVEQELADWWTSYQDVSSEERGKMARASKGRPRRRRSHRSKAKPGQ
jgi:poly(A) polymerase